MLNIGDKVILKKYYIKLHPGKPGLPGMLMIWIMCFGSLCATGKAAFCGSSLVLGVCVPGMQFCI